MYDVSRVCGPSPGIAERIGSRNKSESRKQEGLRAWQEMKRVSSMWVGMCSGMCVALQCLLYSVLLWRCTMWCTRYNQWQCPAPTCVRDTVTVQRLQQAPNRPIVGLDSL